MARKKTSVITWILLGFVLIGLGGFGVSNFSGARDQALASVGGVDVTAQDYGRALTAELDSLAQQTGKAVGRQEAQQMGLTTAVQARLIAAAALAAQAKRYGISVGDEAIARQLTTAPAFAGLDGSFDRARYEDTVRRQGMTTTAFEDELRQDEARAILQRAVTGGVAAPAALAERTAAWLGETRDLTWSELTAADLPAPVADPGNAVLEAWYKDHQDRFTAPETRRITAVRLTPQMLAAAETPDEAALRQAYEARRAEFDKPARRLVAELVYPDLAAATAARARLDAGQATFEQLAAERGLTLADIDQGEVTQADLGPAGAAVFAATDTGVVGPVDTATGPALIAVNAILDPVQVPFEQVRAELASEAALDNARRTLDQRSAELSDRLAGGETLEDLAKNSGMELQTFDWRAGDTPAPGSIAADPSFRERAAAVTTSDYPQLLGLSDGGIFALRLDKLTPPAPIPFAQARPAVLADWTAAETTRRLSELAEQWRAAGTPAGTLAAGLTRDGGGADLPREVVARGFQLAQGETAVVAGSGGRVFLVTATAVHPADPAAPETRGLAEAVAGSLADSVAGDVFSDYLRGLQSSFGLTLHPEVAAAVEAQLP